MRQPGAGHDEAGLVARQRVVQPLGLRACPDEHEGRRHRQPALPSLGRQRHLLQAPIAGRRAHHRARHHGDVAKRPDLLDEVVRHAALQPLTAARQHHAARLRRQVHRRLAGGVRRAHHHHVLAVQRTGLGGRRAVVDTRARQFVHPRRLQARVVHAGGHQHAVAGDLLPAVQRHHPRGSVLAHRQHLAGGEELGAQAPGLRGRAARQVGAAEARREPEVVLDARALPGLPAGGMPFDQQRAQPFRGAVHRRRKAGRPAAQDHQVVERQRGGGAQPHPPGDVTLRRTRQHLAVLEGHHRQFIAGDARRRQDPAGLGIGGVQPAVGHPVAGHEVAQRVRLRRVPVPHQTQAGVGGTRRALGLPVVEQVVQHRVQPLLGRAPGLHQVVVQAQLVDRPDGHLGVGVRRQQHALRTGRKRQRPREEVDTAHARHPLVGQEQRHRIAAAHQALHQHKRGRARVGQQDAVTCAVAVAQVALDRPAHRRIVVHGHDRGARGRPAHRSGGSILHASTHTRPRRRPSTACVPPACTRRGRRRQTARPESRSRIHAGRGRFRATRVTPPARSSPLSPSREPMWDGSRRRAGVPRRPPRAARRRPRPPRRDAAAGRGRAAPSRSRRPAARRRRRSPRSG